jgi:uncharacterized protein YndB with AHSA1/START domain
VTETMATTSTTGDPDVLERFLTIAATPDVVFRYFTDPDRMTAWMGTAATLEPTPGGDIRIVYNDHDIARGKYLEVEAPTRIVFSWGWEAAGAAVGPGASRVEIDLEAVETGTKLRLRHLGLPAGQLATHAEGWDLFLPRLLEALGAA